MRSKQHEANRRCCKLWCLLSSLVIVAFALVMLATYHPRSPGVTAFREAPPAASALLENRRWEAAASQVHAALDTTVDPCDDFYLYACGGWLDNTSVPEDRSRASRSFEALAERIEREQLRILQDSWPLMQHVYDACLDTAAIERAGNHSLLQRYLPTVDANPLHDSVDIAHVLVVLHLDGIAALYQLGSTRRAQQPNVTVAALDAAGFGLPTPDHYAAESTLAQQYRIHASVLLQLAGYYDDEDDADAAVARMFALERQLASNRLNTVQRRDPVATSHMQPVDSLTGNPIAWNMYFRQMMPDAPDTLQPNTLLNVVDVRYFDRLPLVVANHSSAALRDYLRVRVLVHCAPLLTAKYRAETQRYGAVLSGQHAQPTRAVHCARLITETQLGDYLAHVYVSLHFGEDTRAHVLEIVQFVEYAFTTHLPEWLGAEAKTAALDKLAHMRNKIGYPSRWPTLDPRLLAELATTDVHAEQVRACVAASVRASLANIGTEDDGVQHWSMNAMQVNAYYSPSGNEMVFPAAILGGTFYAPDRPPAQNFGGIGTVIGHELTHGFDDEGSQFDAHGRLRPWWPDAVAADFRRRTQCLVGAYEQPALCARCPSRYCAETNATEREFCVHGKLVLGENIADVGGLKTSYWAWKAFRHRYPAEAAREDALVPQYYGLQPLQLFFTSFAQNWCEKYRWQALELQTSSDPHSPAPTRVHGTLAQFPEFAHAFHCPAAASSAIDVCDIW